MTYINTKNNKNNYSFLPSNFHYLILFPDILLYIFLPLGYKIGELLNFNTCLFLSILIQFISLGGAILFILFQNVILILIFLALFNIGSILSSLKMVENCFKFYPGHKGFVLGVHFFGKYFGTLTYTNIGKLIIKKKDSLFIRNKYLLIIESIITIICGLLSLILNNKIIIDSEKNTLSRYESSIDNINAEEHIEEMISDYNLSSMISSYTNSLVLFKVNIKKVIFSKINIQIIFISICDYCKLLFIYFNIYFII